MSAWTLAVAPCFSRIYSAGYIHIYTRNRTATPRLDFLFENGCILHELQFNNSRKFWASCKYQPPFFTARFLNINIYFLVAVLSCPVLIAVVHCFAKFCGHKRGRLPEQTTAAVDRNQRMAIDSPLCHGAPCGSSREIAKTTPGLSNHAIYKCTL